MNNGLELLIVAVTVVILAEVTYLLAKLPKSSIKSKQRSILLDTSVLMDGRIVAIAATGFMGGTLVIPRSVVGEMQFLADNADADKRARARYGLDIVSQLQAMDGVDVELLQDGSRAKDGVDNQLLHLAKQNAAALCTLDYNLNKVAVVEGIQVLNINELAQSLRMAHLPGEQMLIEVTQKGQDPHQGVGYLPDGTMVVVEHASSQLGQTLQVEVTRSLQTAAGKMMFARKVEQKTAATARKAPNNKPKGQAPAAPQQPQDRGAAKPQQQRRTPSQRQNVGNRNNRDEKHQDHTKPKANRPARQNRRVDHESNLVNMIQNQ